MPETASKKFFSIEEVADMLQVNYQLVYNMVRKGEIPAIRIGKLYRILEEDFKDFLVKGRTMTSDGLNETICSVCGKSYMSKLSIATSCKICKAPICKICKEIKKSEYCEIHEKLKNEEPS